MSPQFVNNNSHPVRVDKPSSVAGQPAKPQRIRPGQVVEADGEYADNLEACPGVENATQSQADAYEASAAKHREEGEMPGTGTRLAEKLALGPARVALRRAVHAPLRRVIGDDAAPLGPPSGVESSKAKEAVKSDAQRRAFAPGERLPGERVRGAGTPAPLIPASADPTSGEIENAQARNAEEAEAALEGVRELGEDVLASNPWSSDPPEDGGHPANESVVGDDDEKWEWEDEDSEQPEEDGDEGEQPEAPAETEQPDEAEGPNLTEQGLPAEPYEDHTQEVLAAELERRELPKSGTKDEQIARLRESDGSAE